MVRTKTNLLAAGALLVACFSFACQEVEQPTTTLTQEQWKEVKKNILEEAPEPQHAVGAQFEDKIELIGFDVDGELEAGKSVTFTWYWKALSDLKANWKVFIHLDAQAQPFRQNLDHVPVDSMYQTSRWKKGQVIRDVQTVTLRNDYPAGKAIPYIGWYRGDTRLKVSNDVPTTDEAQPRVVGPALEVRSSKTKPAPRMYNTRIMDSKAVEGLTLDGEVTDPVWRNVPVLTLEPMGNAAKLPAWAKAFVTDTDLYLAAYMADKHIWSTLEERDSETWTEEVFELFIDVDGDGANYLELQISPAGTIFDAHFEKRLGQGEGTRKEQIDRAKAFDIEGLEAKVHVNGTLNDDSDEDQAWTVEIKIPLSSIPGVEEPPANGDTWAVNLYRFDRPDESTTHAYGWSTSARGDFHQVDKFGTFKFVRNLDVSKSIMTAEDLKKLGVPSKLETDNIPSLKVNPSELKEVTRQSETAE